MRGRRSIQNNLGLTVLAQTTMVDADGVAGATPDHALAEMIIFSFIFTPLC